MNYYKHHIGDFNSGTRHLTRVERSLYRDLIELYYDTEQPLPAVDFDRLARRVLANTEEEKEALHYVLTEFFELDGDVWRHDRCDHEIEEYRANNSAKARAGKASAEARRKKAEARQAKKPDEIEQDSTCAEHVLNTCATNHKPLTINHKPIKKTKAAPEYSAAFLRFWSAYPRKISKAKAWQAWQKINPSDELAETIIAAVIDQTENNWRKQETKYIPHPTTWLNGQRWEDDIEPPTSPNNPGGQGASAFDRLTDNNWAAGILNTDDLLPPSEPH